MKILIFFTFLFLLVLPFDMATAQSVAPGNFVPCNGTDCSACDLVTMINTIIVWLFGAVFLIFAVVSLMAGFGLVTSGGNQSALDAAKGKFQNAIIGIIIVMAAWLLVDTIMRGILSGGLGEIQGWGPWSQVQCQVQSVPLQNAGTSEIPAANGTPPNTSVVAQCTDDTALIARYSGSPIGAEAPGLRTMISCYMGDPAVSSITDTAQLFTVDRSNPRCSLTNGNTACGPCSHSNNSMHYGRGSGQGARAVDFNARGASESALYTALQARRATCGGNLNFENDHTHISM